jgi:hypothetical protein
MNMRSLLLAALVAAGAAVLTAGCGSSTPVPTPSGPSAANAATQKAGAEGQDLSQVPGAGKRKIPGPKGGPK